MRYILPLVATLAMVACQSTNEAPEPVDIEPQVMNASAEQVALGKSYAMNTQKVLGGQLKAAMMKGGPTHAIDYCNLNAIALTDSMGRAQEIYIGRVSDRNRNLKNVASAEEWAYIQQVQEALAAGEEAMPYAKVDGRKFTGYYPIVTQAICLNCHGEVGTQIAAKTAAILADRYPEDKATGYGLNEVRGLWVVNYEVQ